MRKIHISYRLPVSFETQGGQTIPKSSSGGLATALSSITAGESTGDLWIGVADINSRKWSEVAPQIRSDFELVPVFLPPNIHSAFYKGFSNSVLWPLFHYFPSYIEFREDYFEAYQHANNAIAQKLLECYQPGDLVWIHDYHLMLVPAIARQHLPDAKIGFFLHIPFPNFEVFRLLPVEAKEALLRGVLGSSLLGFQTWGYASSFMDCVQQVLGKHHEAYVLEEKAHQCKIGAYPISIDFAKFWNAYDHPVSLQCREEVRSTFPDKKIIFSVDRLDYTKGVMNRLNAFELFLQQYPEWKGRVVFILVVVPSRDEINKYWERRQMIELNISRINGLYGNYSYTPVVYQYQSIPFEKMAGLFSVADLTFISPIRDGMNLVAKEFVATRQDGAGVLMLSELAGAAHELGEAMLFNPLDTKQMAEQIHHSLKMPLDEQRQRMRQMQTYIRKHNVFHWAKDFLDTLCNSETSPLPTKQLQPHQAQVLCQAFTAAQKRLILLDYDGTLVNFCPKPELAIPDQQLLDLLAHLGADSRNDVAIVSGRDHATIEKWLGDLPLTLVAEHGAYIKRPHWQSKHPATPTWQAEIRQLMTRFAEAHFGSFVETKSSGIAWHYRNMDDKAGFQASRLLIGHLKSYLQGTKAVVLDGNKVVEVKSCLSDKGQVLTHTFGQQDYDFILAIGDDRTDEDLFEALDRDAYTLKVGTGITKARYRVGTVNDVRSLLTSFVSQAQWVKALP